GTTTNSYASLYFSHPDSAVMNNSVVEYSQYDGIRTNSSDFALRGTTFRDNTRYGVYVNGGVPDLGQSVLSEAGLNAFINNDGGGIQLYNNSGDINAYYNDWGYYTEAEIDAHIYDDDENASLGQVNFNPWFDPSNLPLVVNFGADTLSGEAPLPVQFTDSTLLDPVSWAWDFENDGVYDATDQNPQWMYFEGGTYSVKLKASNATATDSLVKTDYITVTPNQHLRSHALGFDGQDDYAQVNNIPYPEDLTVEAWIKPENFDNFQEIVFWYGAGDGVQLRLNTGGTALFGESAGGNWNYLICDYGLIYLSQWNHIAATKQGNLVNLYINGVKVASGQFDNNPVVENINFGARGVYGDRFFEGLIDEVRIWSAARTQSEIQSSMTSYLSGTETGLQAYYRLNDVAGQVAYDFTGNGYNGTLGSSNAPDTYDPQWTPTNWPYDTYLLADFSVNPGSGIAPLDVQFTDFSMGNPASWQWDFDNDGNFDSYDQNPLWNYSLPGIYTVKLVISDAKGADTLVRQDYITAYSNGLFSYALYFDGFDDYAAVQGIGFPVSDLTIEAWINPEEFNNIREIVYWYGADGVQFRLNENGSLLYGESAGGNWNYVISDTGLVYLNQWNHIAVTKQGDLCNLFINGVNAGFFQFDNNPDVNTIEIGGRGINTDRFFKGMIDEVRVWNTARTQSELQGSMTVYLNGSESGLTACWRMNEVFGQTVYDMTANGYNLTLGSTPSPDDNDPVWTPTNWPYDIYLLADFTGAPTFGITPLDVQFTDFSMGSPTSWQWDFDNDGNIDSWDQNPLWTYYNVGNQTVKLIVSDAKATDTIVKTDYIYVDNPVPVSIETARQMPVGSSVTIEGIVTSGPEYGNLHFIQDATAGMALYGPELNYLRMGDQVRVSGTLADYYGLLEMTGFTFHQVLSSGNQLPAAQTITINQMGEDYESEIVRIDQIDFVDGGNAFAASTNYFFDDITGSTYFRLHANSDLVNQRIPDITVSLTGICAEFNGNPISPYCIYGRDYNDLVYTDIAGWSRQASGFEKRYSMINSLFAVNENIAWATAYDVKGLSTVNQVTKTTDGGLSWQALTLPDNEGLFNACICAVGQDYAWVTNFRQYGTNLQGVYATFDGGNTWMHQSSAIFDPSQGGFPNIVYFWDTNTGVCMGDPTNGYFEIYTSIDGGNNWSRVGQPQIPDPLSGEYGFTDTYTVTGNKIRFSTNMGRIFSSSDQGQTWSVVQTPLSDFFRLDFRDENHGLILQQNNLAMYETSDGGNTWQAVNYSGPVRGGDLKYVPGTTGTYVTTGVTGFNGGISVSEDGGLTWEYFPETHGVHAGATDWVNENTGWFGANNVDATEGGIWKYNAASPMLALDLTVFLQGPFNTTQMNTTLNAGGLLPLSQPYNTAPWNYMGTEAVTAIPNTGIVDWVLVELRDAPDAPSAGSATIVAQQAAFLLNDGSVVSTDGSSLPLFTYSPVNSLFAVIWHRNSIGVMSAAPLTENGGIYSYDFSTGSGQAYGGVQAHKQIAPGIWGMIAADGNSDSQVNNTDKNDVWAPQAGANGYLQGDFNLDAQVNNTDKNELWKPNTGLGGQVPDSGFKCQVPE
ncbi:MAG: PKD domain-containing protein, partial [Bacteroidales bacterium]|nr:PKD domain-containing protein [Bacteroidales bacterium]